MNKVYLSKSRYCNAVQCNKILWLNKYKKDCVTPVDKSSIFENGRKVGELAKGLFGEYEDVEYTDKLQPKLDKTSELLSKKPNIITEASFSYDNNFCSVDILKNDVDGVEIYEVKSSTKVHDIYLDDAAYQYYVLDKLGLNVKKVCIVYINNEYVREKDLNLEEFFNIEDITDIAKTKQTEIENKIDEINEYMAVYNQFNEPSDKIGVHCFNPYGCDYWEYCTRNLTKPNVFDISGMWTSKKFEKYDEGKITFEDLITEDLNDKYHEQIDFELNNKEAKINKTAINDLMNQLRYPLYFLDYETFSLPIPEYIGTKAYQQLPFQYSLHIIPEENAPIEHREFLAEVDDRFFIRHLAERLIEDIPESGSVIVYNEGFEKSRNREMGELYPDLKSEMERINDNIIDFLVPFRNRDYYQKEMEGSYSIKKVLPALFPDDNDLSYHKLPVVHNGAEASDAFRSLKGKTEYEQQKIRQGLLQYCELDTYAMVKIWEKFREIINE